MYKDMKKEVIYIQMKTNYSLSCMSMPSIQACKQSIQMSQ